MQRTMIALSMIGLACGQHTGHIPSRHHANFMSVDVGVRLEVLDWGGSGRAIAVPFAIGIVSAAGELRVPRISIPAYVGKLERHAASKLRHWSRRLTRLTHRLLVPGILPAPVVLDSAVLRSVQDSRIASYSAMAAEITERVWNFVKFFR